MRSFENIIAVIDDGIDDKFFEPGKIIFDIEINEQLQIVKRKRDDNFILNHSTTCATIIKKYSPHAIFASIKILNENAKGMSAQLIKALEWCMDNNLRLINLSLGTIDFRDYDPIKDIVNKAYNRGFIIVAACNNRDIISYPASLENVIGVKSDKSNTLKGCEYTYHENPVDGIDIIAPGTDPSYDEHGFYPANSYAAPRVTALAYNMLSQKPEMSFPEVKQELWKSAKNTTRVKKANLNITMKIDWVENGLFISLERGNTFSKIQFPASIKNKAFFEVEVFSDKVLQSVETSINKSIDHIETIIVFIEHDLLLTAEDEKALISNVLKWNKNFVYLYDGSNLKTLVIPGFTNKVWLPFYQKYDINQGTQAKKKNEVPIILINDFTESKHINKLAELVGLIKKDGYYAVALSEFSISVLFGFEYLSHYEYSQNELDIPQYLKNIIRVFDPDLLIIVANGKMPVIDYKGILKRDLKPDITFNWLQSKDIVSDKKLLNKKVINIFTDIPNNEKELDNYASNIFSINDMKKLYQFIIKTFESNK